MKICYTCFEKYEEGYDICPHCGNVSVTEPVEPIHLMPGTVLAGRYLLGTAVGSGGFGIVYKAMDMKLETIVAVKEFFVSRLVTRAKGLKEVIVPQKSKEEFDYRKERFLAEARNMAKFGAHRSIPNVFEYFEENNTAYIVMEFLKGVNLKDYLKDTDGKMDTDFALMVANEVGNALKSLHEKNIIHRDVAPDNIYICSEKSIKIKLMDLGAAKLADSTDEVIDIILKPGYSPCEQYDNSSNIGPWTDVYALGATLYMMLTGVRPDESTNRKIMDEVVSPHELNSDISENLSNSVMKAMALEKHMRFKNIKDFLEAINGERKIVPLHKEKRRRSVKRLVGVACSLIILLGATLSVYNSYRAKKKAQSLEAADITVWFSVSNGSTETEAMEAIKKDFEQKFSGVNVKLVAIPEETYADEISKAVANGELPTLFESTGIDTAILNSVTSLKNVINSEQFKNAMFLENYNEFYSDDKKIPLAIEIPMAYVITNGAECIDYTAETFSDISDFATDRIAFDSEYTELVGANFEIEGMLSKDTFMNNEQNTSAVLLSSTMILNDVRETLTNYEKTYVYYDNDEINCRFTYEWSIGNGNKNEIRAAERLLSWMLGNVYQSYLMISECNDGQIPVNAKSFESKIQSKYLKGISGIYDKFTFKNGEK